MHEAKPDLSNTVTVDGPAPGARAREPTAPPSVRPDDRTACAIPRAVSPANPFFLERALGPPPPGSPRHRLGLVVLWLSFLAGGATTGGAAPENRLHHMAGKHVYDVPSEAVWPRR